MQNHLSKPEDLMLQNATPLTKSARGPSNISDSCVSCTAPATQADPLHISYACQCFWHCYKTLTFWQLWLGAQSLGPATPNDIWTSKSGPNMCCFWHFISHLPTWLRTRRFSEPTFQPSGATKHWKKHSVSRLFYLFVHLHLLSSDSCSSLIFFLLLFSSLLWLFPPLLFHVSIIPVVPHKAVAEVSKIGNL